MYWVIVSIYLIFIFNFGILFIFVLFCLFVLEIDNFLGGIKIVLKIYIKWLEFFFKVLVVNKEGFLFKVMVLKIDAVKGGCCRYNFLKIL